MFKCDFCWDPCPDFSKCYTIKADKDVAIIAVDASCGLGLQGDWLACESCSILILNSQWDMLVSRVLDSIGTLSPGERAGIGGLIWATYGALWGITPPPCLVCGAPVSDHDPGCMLLQKRGGSPGRVA